MAPFQEKKTGEQKGGIRIRAPATAHLIHCGSSVTVSPGVMIALLEIRIRLDGGPASSRSILPSESDEGEEGLC